jgi:hypothetical protein
LAVCCCPETTQGSGFTDKNTAPGLSDHAFSVTETAYGLLDGTVSVKKTASGRSDSTFFVGKTASGHPDSAFAECKGVYLPSVWKENASCVGKTHVCGAGEGWFWGLRTGTAGKDKDKTHIRFDHAVEDSTFVQKRPDMVVNGNRLAHFQLEMARHESFGLSSRNHTSLRVFWQTVSYSLSSLSLRGISDCFPEGIHPDTEWGIVS